MFEYVKKVVPTIDNLKCYGTDGEKALSDAISAVLPLAQHVRCYLHFEKNFKPLIPSGDVIRVLAEGKDACLSVIAALFFYRIFCRIFLLINCAKLYTFSM